MTSPEVELRRVWQRVADRGHDAVLDALLERHREAHRRYHTATHVMWVCRHVEQLALSHPVPDIGVIRVAALFHDAVYDPRSTTNEIDSASLAVTWLSELDWSAGRRAEVRRLIELTAGHVIDPADDAGAVLIDADLAILGAAPNEYRHYATAVRAENSHIDDATWRIGRARVLQHFLDRQEIFVTATMRDGRETSARANLVAELANLRDRPAIRPAL